jgi:hypothetical protein
MYPNRIYAQQPPWETGLPTACNARRPEVRIPPGFAVVGMPGELHHFRGRQPSSVAKAVSWERSSSVSACMVRISSLAPNGHGTQSDSEIPEG